MKLNREQLSWLALIAFITIPLVNEDFTGLVYQDQPFFAILLDHLAAIGILIGSKALWRLKLILDADVALLQGMICQENV